MDKNKLSQIEKNDNNNRLLFAIICLLVLLIIGLCLYLFVFSKNTAETPEVSAETSNGIPDTSSVHSSEESVSAEASEEISYEVSKEASREVSYEESKAEPASAEESKETSEEYVEPEHGWVINYLGYTYLYYGIGLEQFTFTTNTATKYVNAVNALQSFAPDSNFYHILIPTRCEFTDIPNSIKKSDDFYLGSQRKFMTTVFSQTSENIKNVNVYDAFAERIEEKLYFNTDPNYTHIGAYIAYKEFCEKAGITAISENMYTVKLLTDKFVGKFYTATQSDALWANADEFYYFDVDESYVTTEKIYRSNGVVTRNEILYEDVPSYTYYCFLGEDAPKIEITTKNSNYKSVLVIGDSSAAPFVTLLVPHYAKITYININKCTEDIISLLANGEYSDIVLINYNTNAARLIYQNINTLIGIDSSNG